MSNQASDASMGVHSKADIISIRTAEDSSEARQMLRELGKSQDDSHFSNRTAEDSTEARERLDRGLKRSNDDSMSVGSNKSQKWEPKSRLPSALLKRYSFSQDQLALVADRMNKLLQWADGLGDQPADAPPGDEPPEPEQPQGPGEPERGKPPETEEEFEKREKKRKGAIEKWASNHYCYEHKDHSYAQQNLPTKPDATDRNLAKRPWEDQMARWRLAWRKIYGVVTLLEMGFPQQHCEFAWDAAGKEKNPGNKEHLMDEQLALAEQTLKERF